MTRMIAIGALAFLVAGAHQAPGQTIEERWIASSRTATAITGDIWLSSNRLRAVNGAMSFRLVANNARFEIYGKPVAARIFALTPPSNATLLNGNSFGCGKPVRWVVVWQFEEGNKLAMAAFDEVPIPTSQSSPGFCASYYYVRPFRRRDLPGQ